MPPKGSSGARSHARLVVLLVLAACLVIWWYRRPEQLLHPYIWAEEHVIIGRLMVGGWAEALQPVNGNLSFPATALVALGATVSFTHLPLFASIAATVVFAVTILVVVLPESRWGNLTTRALMALGLALVPANPEVFGVLLYSFWWATLWPAAILGWRRELWGVRLPLLAVASLSSPAAGAIALPFLLLWWVNRRRVDLVSALLLAAGFVVELVVFVTSDRAGTTSSSVLDVLRQGLRTAGLFETLWLAPGTGNWTFMEFTGLVVLSLLGVVVLLIWRQGNVAPLLLFLVLVIYTGASAVPEALRTSALNAGPRYYFLPYVALIWLLLHLWRESRPPDPIPRVASLALLSGMLGLAVTFSRDPVNTTGRLDWGDEIEKCAASTAAVVDVPIYLDGSAETLWAMPMTPQQCRDRL